MSEEISILLVEDSASDALILEEYLGEEAARHPVKLTRVETRRDAIRLVETEGAFDVALYDLSLPDSRGVEGLEVFLNLVATVPVIVLTGTLDDAIGQETLARGAQDFLTKDDLSGKALIKSIRFAMERHRLVRQQSDLRARVGQAEKQQAMATLAAGLAHDIGNMLTPVVMASELGLLTAESKEMKELFEEVRNSSRSASELARQLLAMRTPDGANELRVVAFRDSIELAIGLVRRTIPPTVEFKSEVSSEIGRECKVAVGLTDLQQILINLVANAVHALGDREGGRIQVVVSPSETGGRIEIMVIDNGPGFPEGALENAFKPFYTTKKSIGGTGLGLAMCAQLLQRMEGEIAARNLQGGGAEVKLWIPIAQEVYEDSLDEHNLGATEQLKRILIIDDNEVITTRSKSVLELLGYQVTVFPDAESALSVFGSSLPGFDVVVLDYAMPGINGLVMGKKLRELNESIPIVFATAYADMLRVEEMEQIGNVRVVAKPFEVRELVEAMREGLTELGGVGE